MSPAWHREDCLSCATSSILGAPDIGIAQIDQAQLKIEIETSQ